MTIARIFLNGALVATTRTASADEPRPAQPRTNDTVAVVFHPEHPEPNQRPLVATARLEPLG